MESMDMLRDPTELSGQERTDELVGAVQRGDLLGVVLVLRFATVDEVNRRSTNDRQTAIEAAVSVPTVRLDLRCLIMECLLFSLADTAAALQLAQAIGADESVKLLQGWNSGGREAANNARWLCDPATALEDVDEWIYQAGFGMSDLVTPTEQGNLNAIAQVKAEDVETVSRSPSTPDSTPAFTSPPAPLRPAVLAKVIVRRLPPHTKIQDVHEIVSSVVGAGHTVQIHASPEADEVTAVVSGISQADAEKLASAINGVFVCGRKITAEAPLDLAQSRTPLSKSPPPSPARSTVLQLEAGTPPATGCRSSVRSIAPPDRVPSPPPSYTDRREPRPSSTITAERHSTSNPTSDRRHSPTIASSVTSALPPRSEDWIYVSGLSLAVSERTLYDMLLSEGYSADDIYIEQPAKGDARLAFVRLRSPLACSGAIQALSKRVIDGMRLFADSLIDPLTGSARPRFPAHLVPRERYRGPRQNAAHPPSRGARDIVLDHLPERAAAGDVAAFVERHLGRGTVIRLKLDGAARVGGEQVAYVQLDRHSDALAAFDRLDGRVFQEHAVSVIWDHGRRDHKVAPSVTVAPALAVAAPHHLKVVQSTPRSRSPPIPLAPTAPLQQRSPPQIAPSPSAQAATLATTHAVDDGHAINPCTAVGDADCDIARLRALGVSSDDIDAVQRVWDALDRPPDAAYDRSVTLTVRFGYLPKREAKMALDVNAETPAYPDDEVMQQRFEAFLTAQAGESRDWYTIFLAKVAEFSQLSSLFAETGRRAAASMQQD
ncbi:hypothetical protein JCM3770_001041 [Rhodotorula araucariae]